MSADAFITVQKDGKVDEKLVRKYKKEVLEKGGSKDMKKLFYKFLNREVDVDSLLKMNGIKS